MELSVRGLHSYYGRAHILAEVSLAAAAGEVVAILGRNGAGKSTTLKSIIGLVRPAAGTIELDGVRIDGEPPHRICRRGVGYVPEERRVFTSLSVNANLEVGRQPPRSGLSPWTASRLFELFPNLAGMGDRAAGQMSGGEQQMLTIARTLMGNPAMVLLDEPSEGLAPVIVDQMVRAVRSLKTEGLAIVLSEQNVNFAMKVADRAYIIEKGRIRHECTIEALMADETLRRTYLTV